MSPLSAFVLMVILREPSNGKINVSVDGRHANSSRIKLYFDTALKEVK